MEERQVSVDGATHALPRPFFLIATQNPIELAGTFPLPEAQLDRFLVRVSLGYADDATEARVMIAQRETHPIDGLEPVTDLDALAAGAARASPASSCTSRSCGTSSASWRRRAGIRTPPTVPARAGRSA